MFSEEISQKMIELVRHSIEHFFETKELLQIDKVKVSAEVEKKFSENHPCFVLLVHYDNKGKKLIRGSSGVFEAVEGLGKTLIQLGVNAAFFDPNVPRLKPYELNEVRIHIIFPKILNKMIGSESDTISFIQQNDCGVVLESRGRRAFMLPCEVKEFNEYDSMIRALKLRIGIRRKSLHSYDIYTFGATEIFEK